MMSRRASYLGLVGIVAAVWILAFGCSLDTTGFDETGDVCTTDAHCDDGNVCTDDKCGAEGTCTHEPVADDQYPDGVTGNCKVFECKGGAQTLVDFPEDVDDGDDCTIDACAAAGATHTLDKGAACHTEGGIGSCQADGSCSLECGGIDADGNEIECNPSDDPCTNNYCDKSIGKCVIDTLDGVPQPGTKPGDCGGTYCIAGKSTVQNAVKGSACTGTTGAGNPAIVCDGEGACVGCNTEQDCNPDNHNDTYCFHATCMNTECNVTTHQDGAVLPTQTTGDCKQAQCLGFEVVDVALDSDIENDMNDCTTDTCVAGMPFHIPTTLDSPCGTGGALFCDGLGNCKDCTANSQCGTDTDCMKFVCESSVCAMKPTVANTATTMQTSGDCSLQVCDGMGGTKQNPDNADTPNDANDCTLDQCANGNPVFPPVGVGSVCNVNRICDADGHCLGGTCSVPADCPTGSFCVDGVCCNNACNTTCQACTSALKGSGLNGDCGVSAPGTDNNDSDCPGATVCNGMTGAGACKLPVGQPCSMPGDCLLGFCVDGYCCNTICSGICAWCNGAGTQGTCTNIPGGQDPQNECSGSVNCNGTGACGNLFGNGAACMIASECQSGNCTDGVCCSAACGGLCQSCVLAGNVGTCTSIPVEQDPANECNGNGGLDVCNGAGACGKAKGQTCAGAGECASGFCVDGVCCNVACGGGCQACNVAGNVGTCTNIPSGQDPAAECPGATNCNGNGACALFSNGTGCTAAAECTSMQCVDGVCCNNACGATCRACNLAGTVGTCTFINNQDPANECMGAQVCNGAGACTGGPVGAACGGGGECASTFCVDGVCCNNICNTTCKSCSLAGTVGTCTNIGNGLDPANECSGTTTCNGSGACTVLANGVACSANVECMSGACVDGVCCGTAMCGVCQTCNGGTPGTCTNIAIDGSDNNPAGTCTGNNACDGMGACKKKDGQTCAGMNSECVHAHCVDGYCCNTACSGSCAACNLAGTLGACTNIPSGQDPANECAGATTCNGGGSCGLLANGAMCSLAAECSSGNCVDGYCCNTTCGGTCQACNVSGSLGACTSVPSGSDPANECTGAVTCNGSGACGFFANGTMCSIGGECTSGNCVDGYCCNSTCTGTCQACNLGGSLGACTNIASGLDPANECAGGSCNGAGACKTDLGGACGTGTDCLSGHCVDGVCCNVAACGTCQACAPVTGLCVNIAQGSTDDVPAGTCDGVNRCDGSGACKKDNGQTCAGMNSECAYGHCVDGYCCNSACSGTCQACADALTGMGNGVCSNLPTDTDPQNECTDAQVCSMLGTCVAGPDGTACTVAGNNTSCSSTFCTDGVCCNVACGEVCKACTAAKTTGTDGICAFIPNGADPDSECNSPPSDVCNGAGLCVP